jgi:hypothetical protein
MMARINPVTANPQAMITALAIAFLFRADNRTGDEDYPRDYPAAAYMRGACPQVHYLKCARSLISRGAA